MFKSINILYRQIIFAVLAILCFTPFIDPPLALLLGFIVAQTIGNPFKQLNSKATQLLLKVCVVGLGFGMNLQQAMQAGKEGFVFTIFTIVLTLVSGFLIGKWLSVDKKTSFLISSGTSICGGSAIAAVSPIVEADERQISVALGAVFVLNSVALMLFPYLGNLFNMSQHDFGLWSAIAIHDTSSVVGASSKFGQEALQVATTVKLERALWIIPLSIISAIIYKRKGKAIKIPYFIGLFIITMCISTYLPEYKYIYDGAVVVSKKGLCLTLFLIGTGLSLNNLKAVGARPFIQAVALWVIISSVSLAVILLIK